MMTMAASRISSLLSLMLLLLPVYCYNSIPVDRRLVLGNLAFFSGTLCHQPAVANAVISSKYCASGVGEDCEELSEGNALIKSLQEQSAANREANARESLNAFYMKNYPDYFSSTGKNLVKKADGSYLTLTDEELLNLKRENKIGLEIPKAKGGKYQDLTQKPILVLKE